MRTVFNTLDNLVEMAEAHQERCHDTRNVNVRSLSYGKGLLTFGGEEVKGLFGDMADPGKVVKVAMETGRLNDVGLAQLASLTGSPPLRWLKNGEKCPDELRELILNWKFENIPEAEYLMRQRTEADQNVVRAVLSSQYSIYDNLEFVRAIEDAIKTGEIDVHVWRPQCNDTLRAYLIVKGTDFRFAGDWTGSEEQARAHPIGDGSSPSRGIDGSANGGDGGGSGGLQPAVYITNSEIGGGRVRITGGLYRSWCANGAIVGWETHTAVGVTHRFKSSAHMHALVNESIADALKMSERAAVMFLDKRAIMLKKTKLSNIVDRWGDKYGLVVESRDQWNAQLKMASVQHEFISMFDMINMLTVVRSESKDEQEQIERCAGDMIMSGVQTADREIDID